MDLIQGLAATAASVAAVVDVRSRRIPNWLCGTTLVAGVLIHVWQSGLAGVVVSLAGAALGLVILLPLYVVRVMGAGDIKLLASLGALVGPQGLVSVAVYAAIAGGIMSICLLGRGGRLPVLLNDVLVFRRLPTPSGATAPYAVAIASGVYLSLLLPSLLS